jgi:hypothetical protein
MTPVKSSDAIYSENPDMYPPDGPLIPPNKAWKPSYTADYHDPDRVQPEISRDEYKKFLAAYYQGLKEEARRRVRGLQENGFYLHVRYFPAEAYWYEPTPRKGERRTNQ